MKMRLKAKRLKFKFKFDRWDTLHDVVFAGCVVGYFHFKEKGKCQWCPITEFGDMLSPPKKFESLASMKDVLNFRLGECVGKIRAKKHEMAVLPGAKK